MAQSYLYHLKIYQYLVVIDDIWSTLAWPTIRCALLENNLCSRILTTTRITSVARSCCSPDYTYVYEMKPLNEVSAGELFSKRIFGSVNQCPSHLKDVSSDILRKCGGLPLAVISIASLLASKPCTKEQWESYRNHISSTVEDVPSVSNMQRIISLSYNDLPHYLKTCLLYLSTFPEDFVIPRDQLVRRWIAEGFINTYGGQRLQLVGEYYYNELINRSLIMPATQLWDRHAAFCRVHDVILDLIVSKSIEENFITSVGNNNYTWGSKDKFRRLSLDCCGDENIEVPSSMVLSRARSFSIYGSSEHMPLLSDFQALRVMSIEHNRT
nr:disease resistance protein RGA5-like [Lolium perenne]